MIVYVLVEHEGFYDDAWDSVDDVFVDRADAERVMEINPHRVFEIIERVLK